MMQRFKVKIKKTLVKATNTMIFEILVRMDFFLNVFPKHLKLVYYVTIIIEVFFMILC